MPIKVKYSLVFLLITIKEIILLDHLQFFEIQDDLKDFISFSFENYYCYLLMKLETKEYFEKHWFNICDISFIYVENLS